MGFVEPVGCAWTRLGVFKHIHLARNSLTIISNICLHRGSEACSCYMLQYHRQVKRIHLQLKERGHWAHPFSKQQSDTRVCIVNTWIYASEISL